MKKSLAFILACLSFLTATGTVSAASNAGTCKLFGGTLYTTWTSVENDGLTHIWAAIGDVGSSPNSWTAQEISVDTAGTGGSSPPVLYIDSEGNALVVWEYFDSSTGTPLIGGAVFSSLNSTWTSQLLSDVTSEFTQGDQIGTIDDDGNLVVTWTGYQINNNNTVVRCAIGQIASGTVTWNNSITIPGANFLTNAAKRGAVKKINPRQSKVIPAPKKK